MHEAKGTAKNAQLVMDRQMEIKIWPGNRNATAYFHLEQMNEKYSFIFPNEKWQSIC